MAADPVIETPLTNGTAQGGPNGTPPVQAAPVSETPNLSTAVAQDIANKYPNAAPASLTSGTPQMPAQPSAAQPQGQPATPQTAHDLHQSLYAKALRALSPPVRYLDPSGVQREAPPSLGNSIMSAVAASMLTPMQYRPGPFGEVANPQAQAQQAFQTGQAKVKEQSAAVQKLSDDMQTRKLATVRNNADTLHLYAATVNEQGKMAQSQVDNYAPSLQIARNHDQNLQPGDQKAVLASGLTMKDAMANPIYRDALTKHTLMPDGVVDIDGVPTQTFSVIDPNVEVSMDADSVAIANRLNPQWGKAFENSGGSMQMRLGQLKTVTDQVNSVEYAEKIFGDAAKSDNPDLKALGLKGDIEDEIMKAVRQGAPGAAQARQSLMVMENAKAAGGSTADVLNRLINDPDARPGSAYILQALGITSDAVQKYVDTITNQRITANKLAQQGGMGENAPMAIPQINALVSSYETNPELKPEDKDLIKAMIPAPGKDGQIHMQQKQGEKVANSIREITNSRISESQAAADPDAIASLVNLTVGAGDLTNGKDLFTGNRAVKGRIAYDIASAKMASDIGLNPIHYTAAAQKAKQEKFDEYSSTNPGKVGSQLNSFNTFLTHNADAVEASNEWKRTNSEFWNTPLNKLEQKFGNDPSYIKFKASLLAPDKEFMNFLNAGHAETVEDAKAAADITNVNSSPARIFAAMQQLAKTADDRAAAFGDSYVGVVGTTFPNLINANSRQVLKTLEVPSRATAFNGDLPRNPAFVAHPNLSTLQPMPNLDMAKKFLAAAGNDPQHAVAMAREHGWILQ